MLTTHNLSVCYADKCILEEINIQIPEAAITILIGANGCGKSTLLKSLIRQIHPDAGEIRINNQPIQMLSGKALACQIALIAQRSDVPEGLTVEQLVSYGRYPHRKRFQGLSALDKKVIQQSLALTHTIDLADVEVQTLSGGQLQRVWIAMALAQDTPYLFLDEPTTYLDLNYQIELLNLIQELNEKQRITVVMVLHDIYLTARYADHVIALKNKKVFAQGTPEEVITAENLLQVLNLKCEIHRDPVHGGPMCVPL